MTTAIPRPPGLPVLGNVLDIDPHNTWSSLKKLADHYGEIFKIRALGGKEIVFVASVALCDEVCDEARFRKSVKGPIVEIRHSLHDSLFSAYDGEPSWGIAHRIMAPMLAANFMENYFHDIHYVAKEFTSILRNQQMNQAKNIHDCLAREALETCTLALYGKKLGNMANSKHPMLDAMEVSTSEAILRPSRLTLVNKLLYQHKFEKATQVMRRYAKDILTHRRENPQLANRKDVLTAMLKAKDPETGEFMDEERVIDEIVTLPIGLTTAPALVATTIYYLLQNRHCVDQARAEIESVLGDDDLELSHLSELKYVDGIIKESMRLAAPAPGFNVEPLPSDNKAPIFLASGKYEVPHDQTIITVLQAVNRDPAVWTNPEFFDPERMIGEKFEQLPRGAKRFFGNGKRECIGKDFAWTWCMVLITQMLRDLDIELADSAYTLKQDGWFNLRPVGFEIKVKARH